jgi:hypothetical protein
MAGERGWVMTCIMLGVWGKGLDGQYPALHFFWRFEVSQSMNE